MAIAMLLLAAASCMSQGLSLVMCRCSGDVFVGHAPESCCADCTPEESAVSLEEPGDCTCPIARQGCFDVFSRGWDKYTPAAARDTVPPPTVADASDALAGFIAVSFPSSDIEMVREGRHWPEPPGRPRAELHGSLRL
jgi:hypothetical protein